MEKDILMKKCINHKDQISNFYCFDDKVFLCDICFKDHRKHNVEVKSEIKKLEKIYKNLTKNKSMSGNLEEIKSTLSEFKDKIEEILNKISSMIASINESNPSSDDNDIFKLSYQEYERIGDYSKLLDSIKDTGYKLNEFIIKKFGKKYKNYREINKEVNIIEHSKDHEIYNLNVMLGKKQESFSLFKGSTNQYAIFDFKKKFFLKDILISVKQKYRCVLKNFSVSIKNNEGKWEEVGTFCCCDNNYEVEIQNFTIERETQLLKINFIDTWPHPGESDSMIIKKLSFKVADIT